MNTQLIVAKKRHLLRSSAALSRPVSPRDAITALRMMRFSRATSMASTKLPPRGHRFFCREGLTSSRFGVGSGARATTEISSSRRPDSMEGYRTELARDLARMDGLRGLGNHLGVAVLFHQSGGTGT